MSHYRASGCGRARMLWESHNAYILQAQSPLHQFVVDFLYSNLLYNTSFLHFYKVGLKTLRHRVLSAA